MLTCWCGVFNVDDVARYITHRLLRKKGAVLSKVERLTGMVAAAVAVAVEMAVKTVAVWIWLHLKKLEG